MLGEQSPGSFVWLVGIVAAPDPDTGLPYAVARPAFLFGRGDVLINNVAWLLRRRHHRKIHAATL